MVVNPLLVLVGLDFRHANVVTFTIVLMFFTEQIKFSNRGSRFEY